ncbi:FxsB family cyclophane-forming radical SAM/SPASM peptide maturase [Actinomadura sp. 7K534]|uniref:FxsB family cyclophane-forming radical SAM/SPASM peptide maturase n=1 Tax=Actinomadura sp. 7K534 TaxID=2530366 RepID=UPI001FB6A327|nr:FxsB family cyclophane-forming radical SAM/SPASM peptide maturase [Actinomadura sp. 7K534]
MHSRCDLACRYCYMYELNDSRWHGQPAVMSEETIEQAAFRIAEHVAAHRLESIELVLHGGEPLLAGPARIRRLVESVRAAAGCRVDAGIQTNGLRLTDDMLAVLDSLDVRIGVSLDGDAAANDRHRTFRDGRSSHAPVVRALRRLTGGHRHLFGGLLSTIDLRNHPLETYTALLEFEPPVVDFLLPHGTWSDPPPGRPPDASTPYADWLIEIFDHWYRRPATSVRLFGEIMHLLLGGASAIEAVGLSPSAVLVVETDGSIEQSDLLKAAYAGAPVTGLHVRTDTFDRALALPEIAARQIGADALGAECRACPVMRVCGGGLYVHRYQKESGFRNRSVYCVDLFALIEHIQRTMASDLESLR